MNRQSNQITALYCRVDSEKYSLDTLDAILNQQKALTQYAEARGLKNISVFSDCGYSGTNLNRPEYQHMLREIEAGNVADLVVKNPDRMTRNTFDVSMLLEKVLPQHGNVIKIGSRRDCLLPIFFICFWHSLS